MTTPTTTAALDALEAHEAVRQLKAYYAWACDTKFTDQHESIPQDAIDRMVRPMVEAVFTEDAVWDGSGVGGAERGVFRGHDEIFSRIRQTRLRFAMHTYINPWIRVDGDTARATWMLWHPCTITQPDRAVWLAGLSDDEYVRTREGWRICRYTFRRKFSAPFGQPWTR